MRPFLFLIALAPAFAGASECRFTAQHDFDVDAAGLRSLAFALGSSDLHVEGVPGLDKIEVRAKACASDQAWLAALDVGQRRDGDRLSLTANTDRDSNWSWFGSSYASIDMRVRVPAGLAVQVVSGSGDVDARALASLDYKAGSGDLQANRIKEALAIEVGSGDVKGSDVGSVDIRGTSSGDIQLRDVRGDVRVGGAGSGDLQFDNVGGGVSIGSVGSGDVVLAHVDGDASVDSIGSGDVSAREIGGNFTVRTNGSGDIHHSGVRGTVSVPREDD